MRAAALLSVLLLTIATGSMAGADAVAPAFQISLDDPRMVTRAELVITDSPLPPPADADWRPVELPDSWRAEERYRQGTGGWYRLRLPDHIPAEPQAVYLWRFSMNVAVYFNGELVGDGGSFDEPVARNWNRPLLFRLPNAMWRDSGNALLLRLRVYPGFGQLMPVAIGPMAVFVADYERRHFAQITASQVSAVVMLLGALMGLGLWLVDPRDRTYLFFAGICATSMVYALNKFVQQLPIGAHAWWWWLHSCVDANQLLLVCFVHRALGEARPRLERAMAAVLLILVGLYLAWDLPQLARFNPFTHGIALLASFYLIGWLARRYVQRRDAESALYGLLMVGLVVVSLYDQLLNSLLVPGLWRGGYYLASLAAPALLLVLVFQMGLRSRRALNGLRVAKSTLEQRVHEASAEIEAAYVRQRGLLAEQAAARERERIYRDLHDNLGARLLSLVYDARDDRQRALARDALSEIRTIVAVGQVQAGALSDLASEWELEAELRCENAGWALAWTCHGDAALSGQQRYQLERIVRELVSNALEHAGGRHLEVVLTVEPAQLRLQVADDGRGMAAGVVASGVQARAAHLRGAVVWEPATDGGTVCRVTIPLAAADADDPGARA